MNHDLEILLAALIVTVAVLTGGAGSSGATKASTWQVPAPTWGALLDELSAAVSPPPDASPEGAGIRPHLQFAAP